MGAQILDLLWLAAGLGLIVAGAQGLVRGASRLAASIGWSEHAIGFTIVAFATSTPELATNVLATATGNGDVAFGNVVGSNVANVGLVLGASAVIHRLALSRAVVGRETWTMLIGTGAVVLLGLGGRAYSRVDGMALLLIFAVSLLICFARRAPLPSTCRDVSSPSTRPRVRRGGVSWKAVGWVAGGVVVLVLGARLAVWHAVALADAVGVPHVVIALSLVALGTSLPELATSVVATWRGQLGLALGNVIGSNLFNASLVLGATALVRPVAVPAEGGDRDLAALAAFSAVFLPLAWRSDQQIGRWYGLGLLVAYGSYLGWRLSS